MPIITVDWRRQCGDDAKARIVTAFTDCLVNDAGARKGIVTVIFNNHSDHDFGLAGQLACANPDFKSTVIVTLDWCARDLDTKMKVVACVMETLMREAGVETEDQITVLFHDYPKDCVAQGGIMKIHET